MRIAILSDTHGFVDPRISDVVAECDIAVHAGDIGGADVLLSLHPREQVVAIRGNNDTMEKWSGGEQQMLNTLPQEASVELPGGRLVVVHGDDGGTLAERQRRYRRRYADARGVVYGHSHRLDADLEHTPWLLNPGAAGRTRTYGGPSCLLLDCTHGSWHLETLRFEPRHSSSRRRVRRHSEQADETQQ